MTALGMVGLVGGIVLIIWGKNRGGSKLLLAGILLCISGGCIGIGSNPSSDAPNGIPAMVMLGFILMAVSIVLVVLGIRVVNSAHIQQKAQKNKETLIEFYNECVNNGVKTCASEKEIQKATLIAKKYGLTFNNIQGLFDEAKTTTETEKKAKQLSVLNEKKIAEHKQCLELEKYAKYHGRDKRIAMLTDEKNEAQQRAKALISGASAVLAASQQKEHDWAIHGGIASGIAGPAAGVAAAVNIQEKNAKIREQNAANLKAFSPIINTSYEAAGAAGLTADRLAIEIEDTKTKLVQDNNVEEYMGLLSFTKTTVNVSETGTCIVTTTAKLSKPMIIFGDVNAVIDGTIRASICETSNGKEIGSALLVLPKYGINGDTVLKGMCLYCGTQNKDYEVRFSAEDLWAIER